MGKFWFLYLNNPSSFSYSEILFSNMGQNNTHEFILYKKEKTKNNINKNTR